MRVRGDRAQHVPFTRTRVDFQGQHGGAVAAQGGGLTANLEFAGVRRRIDLVPHSIRSDDFQVLVPGPDGELVPYDVPPAQTYRGVVSGVAGSRVAASFHGGRFFAEISLGGDERWHVEPLEEVNKAIASDGLEYAVILGSDLTGGDSNCGCDSHAPLAEHNSCDKARDEITSAKSGDAAASKATAAATAGSGPIVVAEIAFDADYEFFILNGSSVANTIADIELVMNGVSAIYEEQAGITYEITAIIVRTSAAQPYTSTNNVTLLQQFTSEWNLNMRAVHRDVAHLMTGKTMQDAKIGSAHIGVMCNSVCGGGMGYGFSQSRYDNNLAKRRCLTAHELAHNWGACHCNDSACTGGGTDSDCDIMCSQINGCGSLGCTTFGARALSAIVAARDAAACLHSRPEPHLLPFCDTFTGGLDPTKWTYNRAGSIVFSPAAPSLPNVLRLENYAPCGGASAPDELRSNRILLGNTPSATLAYSTRFVGTPSAFAGELVIEFRTDATGWTELNRLAAGGSIPPDFSRWSHALPSAAMEDSFRMRFRTAAVDADVIWHVDDVTITSFAADQIVHVRSGATPGGDGSSWADAFNDLQDALAAAECSLGLVEEIWVAAGVYKPDRGKGNRHDSFRILDGLALYGGFDGTETIREDRDPEANTTTLSGEIGSFATAADNSYHVVTIDGGTVVLDGFQVTGGNANGSGDEGVGAGLFSLGGSPTIRNGVFRQNFAGQAAAIYGRMGGMTTIEDTTFIDNLALGGSAGAIGLESGAFADMARCQFLDNTAGSFGGAISVYNAGLTAVDCLFLGNQAASAGAVLFELSYGELSRCSFLGNIAGSTGGAMEIANASALISDSLFSGNRADYGGAVYSLGGSASCDNCTFASNVGDVASGGIYSIVGSITLDNSILWNNSDPAGQIQSSHLGGSPLDYVVRYSNVQNWTGTLAGFENISVDPMWMDRIGPDLLPGTLDDNLRLRTGSPSINSGDPGKSITLGLADLDGRERVLCGRVDMGAYEVVLGDFNGNGIADLDDAAEWSLCVTGPGNPPIPSCQIFDVDADGDVDQADGALFFTCFNP